MFVESELGITMYKKTALFLTLTITIFALTTQPVSGGTPGVPRPVISAKTIKHLTPIQYIDDQFRTFDLWLSPDGSLLTGLSKGATVYESPAFLWETATGKLRQKTVKDSVDNTGYEFSPDGRYVVTGNSPVNGVSAQLVSVYDMQNGQRIFTTSFYGSPRMLSSDKKEAVLQSNGDLSIYAYRFDTGAIRTVLNLKGQPGNFRFWDVSGDLSFVITIGYDVQKFNNLLLPRRLWDARTGRERTDIFKDFDARGMFLAYHFVGSDEEFSPDSHYLLVERPRSSDSPDYLVDVYDLQTGKRKIRISALGGWFSPDSQYVVVGPPYDQIVDRPPYYNLNGEAYKIIELSTCKPIQMPPFIRKISAFSPDGKTFIYFRTDDEYLHLWDMLLGKERARITIPYDKMGPDNFGGYGRGWNARFSPDGSMLILSTESFYQYSSVSPQEEAVNLTWWDVSTGEQLASYPDMRSPMTFSADGTTLATLNMKDQIVIWTIN